MTSSRTIGSLRSLWDRWCLNGLFCLLAVGLMWLLTLPPHRRVPLLSRLGVPVTEQLWLDTRVIVAGIHEHDAGKNPYLANPTDPLHRPFNYPRVWLNARFLMGGESALTIFAVLQTAAAAIALLWLVGRIRGYQLALIVPVLSSPAVLLLVERSNTDLLVLAMLAAAVRLASSRRLASIATTLVTGATILKLYPVVALGGLAHARNGIARRYVILAGAILIVWLGLNYESTRSALSATPMGLISYGGNIMSLIVAQVYGLEAYEMQLRMLTRCAAGGLLVLGLFAGVGSYRGACSRGQPNAAERAFLISALIYIATFFVGSSFDYRLVFNLLGVRYILRQKGQTSSLLVWTASWWVFVIVLVWSSPLFGYWSIVAHQVASLGLIPTLGYFVGRIVRREYGEPIAVFRQTFTGAAG